MARIRVCSECLKPVRECICDDEPDAQDDEAGDSTDAA